MCVFRNHTPKISIRMMIIRDIANKIIIEVENNFLSCFTSLRPISIVKKRLIADDKEEVTIANIATTPPTTL